MAATVSRCGRIAIASAGAARDGCNAAGSRVSATRSRPSSASSSGSAASERIPRSLTLAELVDEYLAQHDVQPVTIEKLRWLLGKATAAFGDRRIGELPSQEIAAWRMTLPPGYRFEATQALRQVLNRAVVWGMIDINPAKVGVDNPTRRRKEQRPFESWAEIEAVAAALGRRYGPMVVFAAATGLRPAEWVALEQRDVDRDDGSSTSAAPTRSGQLKLPKTEASMRAVPLQARALDALDRLPRHASQPLVFPGERGGYLDLHNFRRRHWRPAQTAAGIDAARGGSTISVTPSPPSRSVPASRPSTSPATWARA